MDNMDSILKSMRKYPALKRVIENYASKQSFQEKWSEIFGQISSQLVFLFVKEGVLGVGSYNPLWVTEIKHYQSRVLSKIKMVCPNGPEIKEIRVLFLNSPSELQNFSQ